MNKKPAFTLVELLVVLGIIGLLLFTSLLALNVARERSRDYKRIADIENIRANLELYFNNNSSYPVTEGGPVPLGQLNSRCLSNLGFQSVGCAGAIMPNVPTDPKSGYFYEYTSQTGDSYVIRASIEGDVNGLTGPIEAYPSAIVNVVGR
jgi:prepilin-type N-terminal cleavage/methylation domain-containing protein